MVSARDYERIIALAAGAFEIGDPSAVWPFIAREFVGSLFGADVFTRAAIDYTSGRSVLLDIDPADLRQGSGLDPVIVKRHPLSVHYAVTESPEPLRISDLVPPRQWRGHPVAARMREVFGTTSVIAIPLQSRPFRGLSIQRERDDFSDRELAVAARVQPFLVAADRHARALPEAAQETGLTPRQTVVLNLMAEGLGATAIAHRLGISVRTVDKHQERLYRRLGASDRLTAVVRAQRLGLIRTPGAASPGLG